MAHFAKIENGIVAQVIVVNNEVLGDLEFPESEAVGQKFIASIGLDGTWKQTSYNTKGGVHALGGTPLRKNYAGIGYSYDSARDAFIPPKLFASWLLNESTCLWDAPTPMPIDGKVYRWDEPTLSWVETP